MQLFIFELKWSIAVTPFFAVSTRALKPMLIPTLTHMYLREVKFDRKKSKMQE